MKLKRVLSTLLCAIFATGLVGCNFNAPKSASDVFSEYEKAIENVGYSMDGVLNATVTISYEQEGANANIEVPMQMDIAFDVFNDNAHGTMSMNADALGSLLDSNSEFYVVSNEDDVTLYSTQDGENWRKQADELSKQLVSDELLEKAQFEKDDEEYIVTISFSDILEDESVENILDDLSVGTMFSEFDEDALKEIFKDCMVVYTFDAQTNYLSSVKVDNINATNNADGIAFGIKCDREAMYDGTRYLPD